MHHLEQNYLLYLHRSAETKLQREGEREGEREGKREGEREGCRLNI